MDNFERKTKKCDSTLQIRPRTLQARFGEGKKGQGVEPTSSINYGNRALGELVGEKGGLGTVEVGGERSGKVWDLASNLASAAFPRSS